jgi:hypothetical protein
MCHGKSFRRFEERREEERPERLWDLFHRETERPAPAHPVAEREDDREPDREETVIREASRVG